MRRAATQRERGAAAVEFALVAPLLFLVLFGVIDYGVFFADSISLRQGVREAARAGVIGRTDPDCREAVFGRPATDLVQNIACQAVEGAPVLAGKVFVAVRYEAPAPGGTDPLPLGRLRVCALQQNGLIPLVPLPDGGLLRTRTEMAVEVDALTTTLIGAEQGGLPAGANWSWC